MATSNGTVAVVEGVNKTFGETRALKDVSMSFGAGRICALLGANGSGKSTLVRILAGVEQPDSGRVAVKGKWAHGFGSVSDSRRHGISVVHQHTPLVPTMTVAECIALAAGYPLGRLGRIRWRRVRRFARELLQRFECDLSGDRLAGTLDPSERAFVSLAIALSEPATLLVLDEATAAIPEEEATDYLKRIRTLADSGLGIVMVTHRLSEVREFSDDIVLLNDGRVAHSGATGNSTDADIISLMTSARPTDRWQSRQAHVADASGGKVRALWETARKAPRSLPPDRVALEVVGLSGAVVNDLNFRITCGEVVDVVGLPDSGVRELPRLLAGVAAPTSGRVIIGGRPLPTSVNVREAIRSGVVLMPRDRLVEGGAASLSLGENIVLPDVRRYWHRKREERTSINAAIDGLDIRAAGPRAMFGHLSGGNQQKAILGKWLLLAPRVLILDDPTSGVDPRSRRQMFAAITAAAAAGVAIVIFSSEPEQVHGLCDRTMILKRGRLITDAASHEMSANALTYWAA